ncbi:plasmid replication protein RepC [Ancylobacter rudongensis]|uniref:Replication initiation protein RepC n=1 Tax=Ancylobacter rudongensis TaxID=177413 RepID=A0A1G4UQ23_9HYPH|nr:plasmid replication protein RepC [Ancylobacter rudongensis]SCW95748.1 replication initiation protein RepC [Ancylobacter rudongensis]
MRTQSTGWRSLPPVGPTPAEIKKAEKLELFEAARLCARVMQPTAAARFVLETLCTFYAGRPIEGRMLVWPSNELLCERTGLGERTVRLAARQLITMGILRAKDSPNGKRFAQRNAKGQIVTAYGFDLSPLIERQEEWQQQLTALQEHERENERGFDQITIDRRATLEVLNTLAEWFPRLNIGPLRERYERLAKETPRRSPSRSPEPFLGAWKALRGEAEAQYNTAYGGNECRQKDNNNESLDQSCNKEPSKCEGQPPRASQTTLSDLLKACPDALAYLEPIHNERDLVNEAARHRGGFGVHADAWGEGIAAIGPVLAAGVLLWVVQMQNRPAPGARPIQNPGGYFRSMCRLIKEGRVNFEAEIHKLILRNRRPRE